MVKHMSKFLALNLLLVSLVLLSCNDNGEVRAQQEELLLGEGNIPGGIKLEFEAAPPDEITPREQNLSEEDAEFHMEVLATFAEENEFDAPVGGFVAYLNVNLKIVNEVTRESIHLTLIPHYRLGGDSFHYARNVDLPGDPATDSYTFTFFVNPPGRFSLAFHSDFRERFRDRLFDPVEFEFNGIKF
jgi:uncharacterized protein involved in high-affinity Fe2+ transport